ncbi:MAG: M28 family peptidase [Trichocoleus desertorum ATA4-8-CV12]|nr:M28 family peptidase [Trichocoleus desertorum ATA4-8-CV12]
MELKARLQHHLTQVARDRDPYLATAGHFFVQQYIRQQLEQWGQVAIQNFQVQGMSLQNLILDLPAATTNANRDRLPILIGAHYDAVIGSPGADDNATGVAVLLELAQAFCQEPARHPIRLVAFDFEETSYNLAGSTYYANSLQEEPLRLMLALEMLGYCDRSPNSQQYPPGLKYFFPNQGNFIGLIGNLKTIPDLIHLSHHLRRAGVPCRWLPAGKRGLILPDTRRSDHAAFWDRGDRALMVTDTANLRNPHYHKPSDRLETLDLDFLTGVYRGLEMGIRSL